MAVGSIEMRDELLLGFIGRNGASDTRSQDFAGTLEEAVKTNRPAPIDLHVDTDIRPPGTGARELPPMPPKEPVVGASWRPTAT